MIHLPYIDPVAFELFGLQIRWYGISYLFGFICCYFTALQLTNHSTWTKDQVGDLIFYAALGIIFGGSIGFILFYDPHTLIKAPWRLLTFWQPGRSFHGGLLGAIIAIFIYSVHFKRSIFSVSDLAALITPIGIAFGRIGNFINSELFGKTTSMPWGMIFINSDQLPRHPSQLYECFLEGILLFTILWYLAHKKHKPGIISGYFLLLYGVFRIIAETWREPDEYLGYIFAKISMGQILSLPMVLGGLLLIILINTNTLAKFKLSFKRS